MDLPSRAYQYFYRQRWPNGFACPRCGYSGCYTIATRRSPLYQCGLCRHQTTLTAGTVMEKSRTPLDKWLSAVELLSASYGVNAVQLAARIGVSHKSAWLMLRAFRRAIHKLEEERQFLGTVHAGLQVLGPYFFITHILYRRERVILIGGSMNDRTGKASAVKFRPVPKQLLDGKRLTRDGKVHFAQNAFPFSREFVPLSSFGMAKSQLRFIAEDAKHWLYSTYGSIGNTYLQLYLDEYAFRWNCVSQDIPLKNAWEQMMFGRAVYEPSISAPCCSYAPFAV